MKHTKNQTSTHTLADLYRAIDRAQPVSLTYTKGDGTTSVRTVEPYDLRTTAKGDIVLIGMDRESSERRTFRVDRISAYTRHTGTGFVVEREEEVPAPVTPRSEAAIVARELGRDYYPTVRAIRSAPTTPPEEQTVPDQPSDWWTITNPDTGEEVARVYGPTAEDMTAVASLLPEVKALIRRHGGFTRRRLYTSEVPAYDLKRGPIEWASRPNAA